MQDLSSLQNQLLQTSSSLLQELSQLKQHKLKQTIAQFQQDQRLIMQSQLTSLSNSLDNDLNEGKFMIKAQLADRQSKIDKSIEDSTKQIEMYQLLLDDLKTRREAVETSYKQAVTEVLSKKEKCVADWRRSANQFIKKSSSKLM